MIFQCLTPEALHALAHPELSPQEWRLVEPPEGLGVHPLSAPPPAGKPVYGEAYPNHLNTENFSINWEVGHGTAEQAERAGDALEAAWSTLVVDQGWTPPVSSDRYLLWVLLVDDIDATGFATLYMTDDYPEGYPVVYLNSTLAGYEGYWRTLAAHEFHHTIQYALRTWAGGEDSESWYWEASASWASVLVEPETRDLDYTVPWYGDQASLRFDSTVGSHQYGMFVFNSWLDGLGQGPGTMQATWDLASKEADSTWDDLIATAVGAPPEVLWSAFSGAFGNDLGASGNAWPDPAQEALVDGIEGAAEELGAVYYQATEDVRVTIAVHAGSAGMAGPDIHSAAEIDVLDGDVVAVTAFEDGTSWTLSVADLPKEIEEEEQEETDDEAPEPKGEAVACACASGGAESSVALLIVALSAGFRRRQT